MKKILLLGGSRYILPVIDVIHRMGHYAITCDYLPDNIAHKYSDEYHNVSIVEKDAVLKLAEELKIDGVMSFACDPGVVTAAYVAEKMGLPLSGSYKSVSILQNKKLFRKFLSDNGFNVPFAKGYKTYEAVFKDISLFKFPVIVKPTDSAGSKGVTRVNDTTCLKDAVEYAIKFSNSNEFIVEEFIEKKGFSSDSDCFSVDGELKFFSFSKQYFDESAENPYTPSAFSWPSSFSNQKQVEMVMELNRLLKLLDMKTSIYNIETREGVDGKMYIMEVSPRGGGNRLSEMIKYITDVDLIENSVKAAIGEPIIGLEQRDYNGFWAEIILHSNKSGNFKSLQVSDEIYKHIIQKDIWVKEGEKLNCFTGANETIGTLVLKFDDAVTMDNVVLNINKHIQVLVEDK